MAHHRCEKCGNYIQDREEHLHVVPLTHLPEIVVQEREKYPAVHVKCSGRRRR